MSFPIGPFLEKARSTLRTAAALLKHGFASQAGREAYLAAFSAAQAYIADHTGRVAKSHNGVKTQFAQLAMHEPRIDGELRGFLPGAYEIKSAVDYGFGEESEICAERADETIKKAGRFVECIAGLLEKPDHEAPRAKAPAKRKE